MKYKNGFEESFCEGMMITVINKYGLEAEETIDFCKMIENLLNESEYISSNEKVKLRFKELMK